MDERVDRFYIYNFSLKKENIDQRLDRILIQYLEDNDDLPFALSRNKVQKYIKNGFVLVNGRTCKPSCKINKNDRVELKIPVESEQPQEREAQKIYCEIVYYDDDIIIVNKPQGLVVHPAYGHSSGTLVNAILYYFPEMKKNTDLSRCGLVHRLDKDTSGLLVLARNERSHIDLSRQFKERKVKKEYAALVKGQMTERSGSLTTGIGRDPRDRKKMRATGDKKAFTAFEVLETFPYYSFIKLFPHTGRTHQLRVHMNHLKHPIVGDVIYSGKSIPWDDLGLMLCATRLSFFHPTNKEMVSFEIGIPDRFKILLNST
ncbi:MAG: RluA family pseudouridine synthase, partial [Spirochaetes bacterium]|nr:RluA family pseudouridine synthase [Spirochaetota bacterium]